MLCTARIVGHRFRKKRCMHLVFDRGFTNRAFEQKHLIGQIDRIAVYKVYFELRPA